MSMTRLAIDALMTTTYVEVDLIGTQVEITGLLFYAPVVANVIDVMRGDSPNGQGFI